MISIILFPSLAILHLPCVGVEATLKKPLKKTLAPYQIQLPL